MRLWLLRHGEAVAQARSDAERELTARGRQQVDQAAAHLRRRPLAAIIASPYVRAQQSAGRVCQTLGLAARIQTCDWLTPECDPREVLRQLDAVSGDELLLVGHQPLLGALAGLLIHGHLQQPLALHTASLVELEGELLAAGTLELRALFHPQSP